MKIGNKWQTCDAVQKTVAMIYAVYMSRFSQNLKFTLELKVVKNSSIKVVL